MRQTATKKEMVESQSNGESKDNFLKQYFSRNVFIAPKRRKVKKKKK